MFVNEFECFICAAIDYHRQRSASCLLRFFDIIQHIKEIRVFLRHDCCCSWTFFLQFVDCKTISGESNRVG